VAWINWHDNWPAPDNKNLDWSKDAHASRSTPLYAVPPRQPEPEPVAWLDDEGFSWVPGELPDELAKHCKPLYLAPPRNPQDDVGDRFAHRLALMLECAMLNPIGTWDAGHQVLEEYWQALLERDRELGIGHVSALGKD
jgi:hypothetical protein